MLKEKRTDLDIERQRVLLGRLVAELGRSFPDLYYQSTSDIAVQLERMIASSTELSSEDRALLKRLGRRDIQVLLSLN